MTRKRKGKLGSSFDPFLAEEGILGTSEEQALKRILAHQIMAAMQKGQPHKIRNGCADADQQTGT